MARLSQSDQNAVLEALHDLYAHLEFDGLHALMLRLVSRLVPNDWASYNEFTRGDFRPVLNIRIPDSTEIKKRAPSLLACITDHPIMQVPLGSFSAYTMSDFLPWRDFQRSTIFNEYYRHVGVRYQLFFSFDGGQGALRGIALNRRQRDFSARDRAVLHLVSPHFAQAHATAKRLHRIQLVSSALEQPEVSAAEMTLTLRADLRIEGLSDSARIWLERHLGLTLYDGMPAPEPLQCWLRREESLRSQCDSLPEPRAPFRLSGPTGAVYVRFVARDADDRTIILLRSAVPESAAAASGLSGLTGRENEVLNWIARGKSNPEIAIILGVSVRTVYKHVENLFAKLGVESRAQAMVRALEVR